MTTTYSTVFMYANTCTFSLKKNTAHSIHALKHWFKTFEMDCCQLFHSPGATETVPLVLSWNW